MVAAAGLTCVARDTGRVLLLQRSDLVAFGGTWSCPAGAIDFGERPVDAAIREMMEEAGHAGPCVIVEHLVEPIQPFHHFVAIAPEEFDVELNWENDDWDWFDLDRLPEPLHPGWVEVLPYLADVVRSERAPA